MIDAFRKLPSKTKLFYEENKLLKTEHVKGDSFGGGWHFHPEYELVLNTASFGTSLIGDQVGLYAENDLFLFGPNLPHTFICDESLSNSKAECLVLHFKNGLLSESFLDQPEFLSLKQLLSNSKFGICFSKKTGIKIRPLFKKLIHSNGIERFTLVLKILDICSHQRDYSIAVSDKFTSGYIQPADKKMQHIVTYIENNYHNKIQLNEIAGIANMQPNAFCRYFKQNTALSLFDFINRLRVGKACNLLLMRDLSIKEICFQTGYNSSSNFINQFRNRTGMTPKAYRDYFLRKLKTE